MECLPESIFILKIYIKYMKTFSTSFLPSSISAFSSFFYSFSSSLHVMQEESTEQRFLERHKCKHTIVCSLLILFVHFDAIIFIFHTLSKHIPIEREFPWKFWEFISLIFMLHWISLVDSVHNQQLLWMLVVDILHVLLMHLAFYCIFHSDVRRGKTQKQKKKHLLQQN